MKAIPRIEKFMTAMPHTIAQSLSIKDALTMMREHRIRHLPVLDGGELVGVITDRDVKLASAFNNAETLKVEEIMTPEPYTVTPQSSTDQVVSEMAEHKYGCAIVRQENGKVVGVFTSVDAMRVLATTLKENYKTVN